MRRKNIGKLKSKSIMDATLKDDDEADRRRIRQILAKPMKDRMNFLRVKIGQGSSL